MRFLIGAQNQKHVNHSQNPLHPTYYNTAVLIMATYTPSTLN